MTKLVNHGRLERDLQRDCIEYLRWHSVFCWRVNNIPVFDPKIGGYRKMGKLAKPGVPDIDCVLPGSISIRIECKAPGGTLDPDQIVFFDECPGKCFVVDSLDQMIIIFNREIKPLMG